MKRRIIILVLFLIILVLCITTSISLNKVKKEISDFKELIIKENFLIKETTLEYNDPLVIDSYIAYNNDYQIEVITFDSVESCANAFKANITSIETEDGKEEFKTHKRFTSYKYTSSDKYVYIRQEKNTLLYINTDVKYKESIDKLIIKLI